MPELTTAQKEELAVTYAALILHDDGIEVSGDKINAVLKAAGVRVQPYLPRLFARVLTKVSLDDIILGAGSGGAAAAPAAAAPAAAAPAGGAAPAEEKKKPEPKSESEEEDMGFGLFD